VKVRVCLRKFTAADQTLNTAMKSVGEVMARAARLKKPPESPARLESAPRAGSGQTSPAEGLGTLEELRPSARPVLNLLRDRLRIPNCDRIFF